MSSFTLPRHLRQLLAELDLRVTDCRCGKHYVVRLAHARGELPVQTFSQSASDRRALANIRSRLRREIDLLETRP